MSQGQLVQALEHHRETIATDETDKLYDDYQALVSDLDDTFLTACYHRLVDGDEDLAQNALEDLILGLRERRADSSDDEWKDYVRLCIAHPIKDVLHQDPFTFHAFDKPRGYAGDADLLDFIYGVDEGKGPPENTTELGRRVFRYTTRSPACRGVRHRARIVAELIDEIAREFHRPDLLSVAAGHLREAGLSGALKQRRLGKYVAFDADVESLQEVRRCYGHYGVETVAATVRQIITGKRMDLGEFHFIYSTGLYDYLNQTAAKRLTTRLFDMVRPGGHLLIANFLADVKDRGYMESFMDWRLIFRNHNQMLDLAMAIGPARVKDIHLTTDDDYNIVILHLTKKR
jgi:hypothetical protein